MTDAASSAPRRLAWREMPVVGLARVTPQVLSVTLDSGWTEPFRAGQHVDLRLVAPDGYAAQRSYSIASSPLDPGHIELMVERLADGEVSAFLHDGLALGDRLDVRGPIGAPFTWSVAEGGPLLLAGGGSGVVPLLSMLRLRAAVAPDLPAVLILSARSEAEAIAVDELRDMARRLPAFRLFLTLTRAGAVTGTRTGRVDAALIAEALAALPAAPQRCFLCGSGGFVGHVADLLLDAGLPAAAIRTERFG